jgi:malonyl CoA-acyl carrier protein transacylase
VPTALTPWPAGKGRRLAGVSSFGLSGTNAHAILEEAPPGVDRGLDSLPDRSLHVLPLSAKTPEALEALVARWRDHLEANPHLNASDVAFTAGAGRAHFAHRLAVVGSSTPALAQQLRSTTENAPAIFRGHSKRERPKVAWLFTGQGSQYAGMARALYETQPTFRRSLHRSAEILESELDRPLLDVLYPASGTVSPIDQTVYAQPALFAVEFALAELWRSWGIEPSAVLGHSVGEYVAAAVAGVFSLEDALKLVATRGRLMQALPAGGAMVALAATEGVVSDAIARSDGEVSIASVNARDQVVISGRANTSSELSGVVGAGRRQRGAGTSHAFHSSLVEPMLDRFAEAARSVRFSAPKIDLFSNVTGEVAGEEIATADYWRKHARGAVQFERGIRAMHAAGCRVFLEVGPNATLLALARRTVLSDDTVWVPTLLPKRGDWDVVAEGVAALYVNGAPLDWAGFDREYPRRKVALPTYPFQRQRYWIDAPLAAGPASTPAKETWHDWLYEYRWEASELTAARSDGTGKDFKPDSHAIAERTALRFGQLCRAHGVDAYRALTPAMSALCSAYVASALASLGCELRAGRTLSIRALVEKAGIDSRFERLLGRMFEILAEDEVLRASGSNWEVLADAAPGDPGRQSSDLLARFPQFAAEIRLLTTCGAALADVLRGERNPMELLFPGGSLDQLERIYQDAPGAHVFNGLVADAVRAAVESAPAGRAVRILEIGAGTGGTTAAILPALAGRRVDYTFTDVSSVFTARASRKFNSFPSIAYKLLDISRQPGDQGFAPGNFGSGCRRQRASRHA